MFLYKTIPVREDMMKKSFCVIFLLINQKTFLYENFYDNLLTNGHYLYLSVSLIEITKDRRK